MPILSLICKHCYKRPLHVLFQASYAFCKDVAIEQLANIEGEALYPTATVSTAKSTSAL